MKAIKAMNAMNAISVSQPEHLVVIGNGMAAIRLVEELVRRTAPLRVTVIGDEPGPAYNRILLSAVLEGSHPPEELRLKDQAWYAENGVELISGTRVVRIDRDERVVWLADERRVPYDRLVLATGSVPVLPPIRGLVTPDGALSPKVYAFRSMADCLGLLRALPEARRAVVVGGGLLGLQVARALGVRGLEVDLVEAAPHLLASHIGEPAGAVLRRSVEELGCEVLPGDPGGQAHRRGPAAGHRGTCCALTSSSLPPGRAPRRRWPRLPACSCGAASWWTTRSPP